jgi:nitrous oxide reductase accessory protein NosL
MIVVTDNRSANRFEARDGGTVAGFAQYPELAHLEYRAASTVTD